MGKNPNAKFNLPIDNANWWLPLAFPIFLSRNQEYILSSLLAQPSPQTMNGPSTSPEYDYEALVTQMKVLNKHVTNSPNPAPLGLFAFGFTTALLQVKHTGIGGSSKEDDEGVEAVVLGFAMFFGGLLQVIAGLGEVKRNNIFGYTAFLLFGGLWMSLGTVDIVQLLADDATSPNPKAMQAMLFLAGLFTFILWLCTFKLNKTLNLLFILLATTLFLLSGGVRNETVDAIGGWFGLATAAVAYWLAGVELVNDIYGEGKEVIPLGHFAANRYQDHGAFAAPGKIQAHRASILFGSRNAAPVAAAQEQAPPRRTPEKEATTEDLESGPNGTQ